MEGQRKRVIWIMIMQQTSEDSRYLRKPTYNQERLYQTGTQTYTVDQVLILINLLYF